MRRWQTENDDQHTIVRRAGLRVVLRLFPASILGMNPRNDISSGL